MKATGHFALVILLLGLLAPAELMGQGRLPPKLRGTTGTPPGLQEERDIPDPPRRPEQARNARDKIMAMRSARKLAGTTETPPGIEEERNIPESPKRGQPDAQRLMRRIEAMPGGGEQLQAV